MTGLELLATLSPRVWVTRDGRWIVLSSMETSHLRNVLAMIVKKGKAMKLAQMVKVVQIADELASRGETSLFPHDPDTPLNPPRKPAVRYELEDLTLDLDDGRWGDS